MIGLGGIILQLRVKAEIVAVKTEVGVLHVEVNHRLSALLALTGTSEHALGVLEGTATELARATAAVTPDG
jgi:hypothetical protein